MKKGTSAYPLGGACEPLEQIRKNNPDKVGLDLLSAFTVAQYDWMLRCVGEEYANKSDFAKRAAEDRGLLRHFLYRIAVAGVQSAGKTTVLNTLLDFPYMPTAEVVTTSCSTSIQYGEKPEILIIPRKGEKKITISLERFRESLFREMKAYVVNYLIRCYGATSLTCLTEPYEVDEYGRPILDESMLHLDYANLRHRAALVLHVLAFYVDQNVETKEQQEQAMEVNRERLRLMKKLGIPDAISEYDITFKVDSPILKGGLVFVDLPGKGSIVGAGNGNLSHNEVQLTVMNTCQAVMLLFEPKMDAAAVEPLDDVITFFKERKVEHNRIGTALIPVLNRMDVPGASGSKTKIDSLAAKRGLSFTFENGVFRISALKAEKRFFDANPEMRIQWSSEARRIYNPDYPMDENMLRAMLDMGAKKSNFDTLYNYLHDYADASRETICLEILLNTYRGISEYLNTLISSLRIKEKLLNTFIQNADQLVDMMLYQMLQPLNVSFTAFLQKFDQDVNDFIQNMIPAQMTPVKSDFLKNVQADHDKMAEDLRAKADILTSNMVGDIVLWREYSYKEYVQPNYRNYKAMSDIVDRNSYDRAFNCLRDKLTKLHRKAQRFSEKMESNLEQEVTNLTGTLRSGCDAVANVLMEQEYGEAETAALLSACDEIRHHCDFVDATVRNKLQALAASEKKTVNDAMSGAYKSKAITLAKLQKKNTECFDNIITTGVFRTKTYLTYPGLVESTLSEISGQSVKQNFEQACDSAITDIKTIYQKLFVKQKQNLSRLYTNIHSSLQGLVKSVTDDLRVNREILKAEIQEMRDYLARVRPLLPADGGTLGLQDPQALKQWEAIQAEYKTVVKLLKPYRKEEANEKSDLQS